MSKEIEREEESAELASPTDIVAMIRKMQQQLHALDKKIDILMSRPKDNTFGEKRFSGHGRSFGRSSFHGRGERHHGGRSEYRHGGREFFGGRDSFRPREDRDGNFREQDSREGSSFGKKHYGSEGSRGGEARGFAPKKKPFFLKHKNRE